MKNKQKIICTEDYQECDKCDREDCMIKKFSKCVVGVKEI